jgi:hypothetical protein
LNDVLVEDGRDIVMFAAPPPDQGVRGIDAFRETRPGSSHVGKRKVHTMRTDR